MSEESDGAATSGNLGRALAGLHLQLSDWNGVPSAKHLADALRSVRADYSLCTTGKAKRQYRNFLGESLRGPSQIRHGNNLKLLDAVIDALEGTTEDGRKLKLTGRQGPSFTSRDFDERLEIAAYMMELVETDGYESAVRAAMDRFKCKSTKVKDSYAEYKWFRSYLSRIEIKSPDDAARILGQARAHPL